MITVVVFLFITVVATSLSTDYCSTELCDGSKHVACNHPGGFAKECPSNAVKIEFTDQLIELAVKSHNKFRDQIAQGQLKRYQKAAKMAALTWSDELAKLAEYNVLSCIFRHDECRNTHVYRYAGQNLGQMQSTKPFSPEKIIETITTGWFNEHNDADMSYIGKYRRHENGKQIGHFTQLVRDEAFKVGCAMVTFKKGRWNTALYACDYSLTNILDMPIYQETDKTASGCKSGQHEEFKGLCSPNEVYNNPLFYN